MTSSRARKQTQQLLFTVIITRYQAPSGLNRNQHATVTSHSHTVYTLLFFFYFALFVHLCISQLNLNFLHLHKILQLHKFALNITYCELALMAKAITGGHLYVLLLRTMLSLCM